MFNLMIVGEECLSTIKRASWFPYKSGHLRNDATGGWLLNKNTYKIHFDSSIAEYIPYLEEGTGPHNIPKAFGRKGRFDGKFHPGSNKHKGFIKDKSVNAIVEYIAQHYKGVVEII